MAFSRSIEALGDYEIRDLAELPAARQPAVVVFAALAGVLDDLPEGKGLFFPKPGAERQDLNQQRDRMTKGLGRVRPKAYRFSVQVEPPGIWCYRATDFARGKLVVPASAAPTLPDTPPAAAPRHEDPDRYFVDAQPIEDADAEIGGEPDFATEYQPTDLDIPPGMADDDEEDEEIPPVAKKKHCGCPAWWKEDSAWRPELADKFGAHHFAECALYLPAPIVEKLDKACSCDPYAVAGIEGFRADVANEAHEKTCPMYRAGAHWWQIPTGASNFSGYTQVCRWCGAEKEIPATGSETMPVRLPERRKAPPQEKGRRICPDCGQGYASAAHRAHKAGANA